jgi:hypothetical protein
MEPLITTLPVMNVVCFEAFLPDSESKAFDKMKQWLKEFNPDKKPYRIFGHNIDLNGNISYSPQHEGYKILLNIESPDISSASNKVEVINSGKFLVVRTEGQIDNIGQWLGEGWNRVNEIIQGGKIKLKESPRWYEEHIRTEKPDYVIVDLYLEMEN